jgi:signal transduction histidine kinase/DNA-binding NarL/FixJ family response regulator
MPGLLDHVHILQSGIPESLLPRWQQTIDLMARIYDVPAGLIMRVHTEQIEVFLASQSQGNLYELGERADLQTGLYCETVMAQQDQLFVPNALQDPVWDHNPDIVLGMICYLGVPLCWPDDTIFGTICVLDVRTRHFSQEYKDLMWQFKQIIEGDLRLLDELRKREQIEEELRTARDAAEAANRAKSTFLANMSHELRTPLNAILGFTQLMSRNRQLDTHTRDNLGIVRRSGEHLLGLINNVLDLSRIEAGHVALQEDYCDLHRLLEELDDMFQLQAADKHLELVVGHAPDVPRHILSDQVKLRQVLINLLGNALKFTQQGHVKLRVEADSHMTDEADPAGQVALRFVVEDTGPGIAADELSTIFEAFTQTESGRQVQESTGLGLSISQRFVRLMGGEMSVHSEVGHGSVFGFTIPVQVTAPADGEVQLLHRQVIGLAPDQPVYRILVVDDRWANRQLLMQLLAPLGFEVREASNGQEALDIWDAWQPHLIWMDMRMPVMDGYEATRRIKANLRGQATAVVALTASTLEEERAVVLSTGCDDFVRKPFQEMQIFETMRKHLGVRYIYEESPPELPVAATSTAVTPATLATIPSTLLLALEQALLTTAPDEIEQIIGQIGRYDSDVARVLAALAEDFEYTRMLALLESERGNYAAS